MLAPKDSPTERSGMTTSDTTKSVRRMTRKNSNFATVHQGCRSSAMERLLLARGFAHRRADGAQVDLVQADRGGLEPDDGPAAAQRGERGPDVVRRLEAGLDAQASAGQRLDVHRAGHAFLLERRVGGCAVGQGAAVAGGELEAERLGGAAGDRAAHRVERSRDHLAAARDEEKAVAQALDQVQ